MSRELILEWAIFILIGHPLPSCLLSKGLVLMLTAFSSCLKLRAHPGRPAPSEPSLPVPLLSLQTCTLGFKRQLCLSRSYFGRSEWFFKSGADLCGSWTGVCPRPCWGWMARSAPLGMNGALLSAPLCPAGLCLPRSAATAPPPGEPQPQRSLSAPNPATRLSSSTVQALDVSLHSQLTNTSEFFLLCYTVSTWSEKVKHPHSQSF